MSASSIISKSRMEALLASTLAAPSATTTTTAAPAATTTNSVVEGNSTRDKAMELLGKNIPQHTVASILGISPSRISQFMEEPDFKDQVQARLIQSTIAASNRDAKKDALEDALLTRFEDMSKFITRPMELLKALQVVSALPRRAPAIQGVQAGERTEATLTLPSFITNVEVNVNFQYNTNREVVEVDGRTMQTMPMHSVLEELEQHRNTRLLEHQPAPDTTSAP